MVEWCRTGSCPQTQPPEIDQKREESGGANRDRTGDLYNAIVALSQLSYSPTLLETGLCILNLIGFVEAFFRRY